MPRKSRRSCSRGEIAVRSHNAVSGKRFTYCRTSNPLKPSKGWKKAAPRRGSARHALYQKCGSKCFLLPSAQKFPICASSKRGGSCKPDCRGLLAAERRARQYKYNNVATRARRMAKSIGCEWVH